jgi:hypothetical protein
MPTLKLSPRRIARRPASTISKSIRPLHRAATKLSQGGERFEMHDLLEMIYSTYIDWKRRKIAKRSARTVADEMNIVRRKGTSPIRILIEATLPTADVKQKSRWVRALEYISLKNVSPSRFRRFVRNHGGISGCARRAVRVSRKRACSRRECVAGRWDD